MTIEIEQEDDRRWLAEIPPLPGAPARGISHEETVGKAGALALRAPAETSV